MRNKSHQHSGTSSIYVVEGETLRITHVTKRHMGIYYCIASNGVPPSVSKRVAVTVLCKFSLSLCVFISFSYMHCIQGSRHCQHRRWLMIDIFYRVVNEREVGFFQCCLLCGSLILSPPLPCRYPGNFFFPSFPSEHQQLLKEEEEEDYIDLM